MTLETLKIEFQAESSGLEMRLSTLIQKLDGFAGTLDAVAISARPAGDAAAAAFASGIEQGSGQARQAAVNVVRAAKFADASAVRQATQAGAALTNGFARGISSRSSAVYSAVQRMVSRATQMIRSQLGIHSPSKVAGQFGAYFGAGFAQGIQGSVAAVSTASSHMADAATFGLQAGLPREVREAAPISDAVNAALGDLNITIPLNVDGIKLGEASIRGINAVTRNAGRLLLNI